MKTILIVIAVLSVSLSAFGDSLADQIRDAEVIAIVSVPAVTRAVYTNSAGHVITNYSGEATAERVFKGTPPKTIHLKDEGAASILSNQDHLATSAHCFLAFLKRSGDFYTTSNNDDLAAMWGNTPGSRRVIWRSVCLSDDEAIAIIAKALKN